MNKLSKAHLTQSNSSALAQGPSLFGTDFGFNLTAIRLDAESAPLITLCSAFYHVASSVGTRAVWSLLNAVFVAWWHLKILIPPILISPNPFFIGPVFLWN